MSPTLSDGDVILVSRRARPRPGAVVLVGWPQRPEQLSVKRIVGRHGDGWWVLGDNPDGSTDSRQLGSAQVYGVVLARLWPTVRRLCRHRPARNSITSGTGSSRTCIGPTLTGVKQVTVW